MTEVSDPVQVAIVTPIGNSDHSYLSAVISMAQAVQNLCVCRKVYLKHHVICYTACGAIQDLPWRNIWSADNPVEDLNENLLLPDDQPRSSVCVARIRLGLMINAGMLLASSRRLRIGGHVIALGFTGNSFSALKWELMKPTRKPSVSLVSEQGCSYECPVTS